MTASPDKLRRVALLARPGAACERLRAVLDEAGALCVLTADPTQLEPADLLDAQPQVVLIALDPAIEDVLARFDPVLGDPSIDVIYEEAEFAAAREGWAVARWQRHLVAKLHGHADVLPPGREPEARGAIAGSQAFAAASPSGASSYAVFDPIGAEFNEQVTGFDGNAGTVASGFAPIDQIPGIETAAIESNPFDPVMAEVTAQVLSSLESPAATADDEVSSVPSGNAPAIDSVEIAQRFERDLGDIERRILTLELVDDTPRRGPEQARGAVLVLSGIGGPDAVRQLLGALPDDFARPVLVQQRLDGGRYDKLVTQLQRATALPVKLAEPGQLALAGLVYILPLSVGLETSDYGLRFNNNPGDEVMEALPPADSAVLLLSGSDPGHIDAVMKHSWGGALVAGQAADGCYDAAAPDALAARGGDTAQPGELALRLVERWSSRGTEDVQA